MKFKKKFPIVRTRNIKLCQNGFLGSGLYGSCNKTTDGEVFKRFNSMEPEYDIANLAGLVGFENETYVMPSKIVLNRTDKVVGVIMPYIPSKNLYEKSVPYDELCQSIDKMYKSTDELSSAGISNYDIRSFNILKDKDFKIIDTDMYHKIYSPDQSTIKFIENDNIRTLNIGIIDILGLDEREEVNDLYKLIFSDSKLTYLHDQLYLPQDNRLLKEFLIALKQKAEYHSKKQLIETEDFKRFKIR